MANKIKTLFRPWRAIVLLLMAPGVLASDLSVTLEGIRADEGGVIKVFLYDSGKAWLKEPEALASREFTPDEPTKSFTFDSLDQDATYAIQLLHDADGDGKLKYRMFPPKILEGFGFSNNYVPTTKPRFSKARFRLADVSAGMTIRLVYPD